MKNISIGILIVVISTLVGFTISQEGEYIEWQKNRPLKWSDFKGKTPLSTTHAALTNSGVSLDLSFRNGTYEIGIVAQFDKRKSWHKKDTMSEHLLGHEQLHFDITELFARKLRKALLTGHWKNSTKFETAIQTIYSDNAEELSAFQDSYDKASDHSLKIEAQQKWEGMIGDSLEFYSSFKGQNLTIKL